MQSALSSLLLFFLFYLVEVASALPLPRPDRSLREFSISEAVRADVQRTCDILRLAVNSLHEYVHPWNTIQPHSMVETNVAVVDTDTASKPTKSDEATNVELKSRPAAQTSETMRPTNLAVAILDSLAEIQEWVKGDTVIDNPPTAPHDAPEDVSDPASLPFAVNSNGSVGTQKVFSPAGQDALHPISFAATETGLRTASDVSFSKQQKSLAVRPRTHQPGALIFGSLFIFVLLLAAFLTVKKLGRAMRRKLLRMGAPALSSIHREPKKSIDKDYKTVEVACEDNEKTPRTGEADVADVTQNGTGAEPVPVAEDDEKKQEHMLTTTPVTWSECTTLDDSEKGDAPPGPLLPSDSIGFTRDSSISSSKPIQYALAFASAPVLVGTWMVQVVIFVIGWSSLFSRRRSVNPS